MLELGLSVVTVDAGRNLRQSDPIRLEKEFASDNVVGSTRSMVDAAVHTGLVAEPFAHRRFPVPRVAAIFRSISLSRRFQTIAGPDRSARQRTQLLSLTGPAIDSDHSAQLIFVSKHKAEHDDSQHTRAREVFHWHCFPTQVKRVLELQHPEPVPSRVARPGTAIGAIPRVRGLSQ